MLRRLYYRLKPYLPWHLRMSVRRVVAQTQRRLHARIWPINPTAGEPPAGWPGWPHGKKFALVLTHDIEGAGGLAKARQLVQMEQELGFRSSFNFIPEGDYQVPPAFRAELVQAGFEVGVHDLRHDGKLYWNPAGFADNARRINGYLRDWQAVGFRAGFMLRDRDCLNDLAITYDATTFDTDPFEPQPEGSHTIFPYWIALPQGGGYVELPYTLAQDSTIFLVLQEKDNSVWKTKLDWIARQGGMALLNVHPDYLGFAPQQEQGHEYAAQHYREFLQYVARHYAGQYWLALPREMADWYREHGRGRPQSDTTGPAPVPDTAGTRPLIGKRAAVVLFSYYAADPRPRRETEALGQAGMEVDVICLRQDGEPRHEILNGINVHRIPMKRRRAGKFTYVFQYGSFLLSAFLLLSWWRLRRRYQLVHVHNMPDFLVFSALLPKLCGARVILDLHDPMPELLVTIFGLKEQSAGVRTIKLLEKWSMRFADLVITVNRACEKIFLGRSCPPEKIQVLMNVPDERIFKFRSCDDYPPRDPAAPFVIMYHGSIVERNGLDVAVAALKILRQTVPAAQLWIFGGVTPFLTSVLAAAQADGLADSVRHLGSKTQAEIVQAIYACDVGVIPNRNNAFTEINTPTRIFEYLSLGKPVIAPSSAGITDYFTPEDIIYFELGSARDLAVQLQKVYDQPAWAREITRRGQAVYRHQCWSRVRHHFINRVVDLLKTK